ncbi:hypothetical protein BH20ACT2_BH20ACT2_25050 [soil metagenome]
MSRDTSRDMRSRSPVHRVGYVVGAGVLVSSGVYVFVYLYRWEWNRALFAAAMFIAAEVALLGAALLEKVGRLERRLTDRPDPQVRARVAEAAPPASKPFEWLDPRHQQMNVFVPILMGVGIVASGLAWLVERLAGATAGRALEHDLAVQLGGLAWPRGGLVPPPDEALTLLDGPALDGPAPGPGRDRTGTVVR